MELLQYTFFQHALLGSLLASIICGLVGTYIVTRRLVFISGGLTHASFGGIGLGLYLGVPSGWRGVRTSARIRPSRCSGRWAWLRG